VKARSPSQAPVTLRPKRRSWWPLLLVIVLAVGGYGAVQWFLSPLDTNDTRLRELEVLPGWGASRIAVALAAEGLIREAGLFSLYLRVVGLDTAIGEGLYDLSPAMSTPELARTLAAGGRPRLVRVTIPEGFRIIDVAERLAEAGLAEVETFMALFTAPGDLAPEWLPEGATLEGYLFPATYDIPVRSTPEAVAAMMVRRFQQELTNEVRQALAAQGFSVHDWVILASIVQSEAGTDTEMPIIAGVFRNRLDIGMPLQADPTVAYGFGKRMPELDVPGGDLRRDHPWNTYTRVGLPQGPISNPGRPALLSVLHPQRENAQGERYLFFLHGRNREFRPNLTLEEHNRDVQQFLR